MTKSALKKEKDKLLISKNTTIGRLRANDKELIAELRKFTNKEKIIDCEIELGIFSFREINVTNITGTNTK